MKKLLLPSIIAMLAVPAFATTPTTLPNNALCNETNLGTESGSADIEVVWTPNTINTQWFTGYGENTAAASATTCEYGGTINLPHTNPSRPGYAFAGWKLRAPQCSLSNLDASIDTTYDAQHVRWKSINGNAVYTMQMVFGNENSNDLNNGEVAMSFSYGDVKFMVACSNSEPDLSGMETLSEQLDNGEITEEQAMIIYLNMIATSNIPNDTPGVNCWARVVNYTLVGEQQCTPSSLWVHTGSYEVVNDCLAKCAKELGDYLYGEAMLRSVMYSGRVQ